MRVGPCRGGGGAHPAAGWGGGSPRDMPVPARGVTGPTPGPPRGAPAAVRSRPADRRRPARPRRRGAGRPADPGIGAGCCAPSDPSPPRRRGGGALQSPPPLPPSRGAGRGAAPRIRLPPPLPAQHSRGGTMKCSRARCRTVARANAREREAGTARTTAPANAIQTMTGAADLEKAAAWTDRLPVHFFKTRRAIPKPLLAGAMRQAVSALPRNPFFASPAVQPALAGSALLPPGSFCRDSTRGVCAGTAVLDRLPSFPPRIGARPARRSASKTTSAPANRASNGRQGVRRFKAKEYTFIAGRQMRVGTT